jgi:hypothetical protein
VNLLLSKELDDEISKLTPTAQCQILDANRFVDKA